MGSQHNFWIGNEAICLRWSGRLEAMPHWRVQAQLQFVKLLSIFWLALNQTLIKGNLVFSEGLLGRHFRPAR